MNLQHLPDAVGPRLGATGIPASAAFPATGPMAAVKPQQQQQQQDKILQTLTTKAYNITIAVPQIHRCYIPVMEEEEDETEANSIVETTAETMSVASSSKPAARSRANTAESLRGAAAKAFAGLGVVYNDASSNDVHPLLKVKVEDNGGDDVPPAPFDNFADMQISIEGIDETGDVVVKLEPPKSKEQKSQQQQHQPNSDIDLSENSHRSQKLQKSDRHEAPMMPDNGGGDIETGSIHSVKATPPPPPAPNGHHASSGTEEIIGYVQGEETPPKGHKKTASNIPQLGHKKTASNVPTVKDIITAEEMAAVVKLTPKTEQAPEHFELQHAVVVTTESNDKQQQPSNQVMAKIDGALKMVFGSTTTDAVPPASPEQHGKQRRVSYLTRDAAIAALRRTSSWSQQQDFMNTSSPQSTNDKPVAADIGTITEQTAPPTNDHNASPEPNTEIKVSVLTELALKNLLLEGHLLHRPISIPVTSSVNSDMDQTEWVEFTILAKEQSIGIILERLERIGVGSSVGSVSIFKAELCRTAYMAKDLAEDREDYNEAHQNANGGAGVDKSGKSVKMNGGANGAGNSPDATIVAARNEWRNAASRLRVEQVKEQIHEQAELSFDYVSLLVIASLLAGIGLITDSTVVIVASMLVSPIMGPVMGMTFNTRVFDWEMVKFSFRNEVISLMVSVFVGVLITIGSFWTQSAEEWPTEQMELRGTPIGLATGVAIAIPSGMGVALSILGNNTSSLVGVAISASLLPPAVNAGICWTYALFLRIDAVENISEGSYDFAMTGLISFALTLVNIVCIWFAGIAMFGIKEVAPSRSKSAFWENDIKTARAIKKGNKKIDLNVIRAGLQDALSKQERVKAGEVLPPPERRTTLRRRSNLKQRQAHRYNHHRHGNPPIVDFNIHSNPSVDESVFEEALDDTLSPSPLFDDVKYMSMGEMAHVLGFDPDADAFVEETSQDIENEGGSSAAWYKFCNISKSGSAPLGKNRSRKLNVKMGRFLMLFVFGNLFVAAESFSFARLTKRQNYGSVGDAPSTPGTVDGERPNNSLLFQASSSDSDGSSGEPVEETELAALFLDGSDEDRATVDEETGTGQRILELAIPALGALLIDPLLTLADTAFVGRFAQSPYELAGMGSATALLTFSFYIFNFLCTATTPLVASKRSSGKENEAIAVGGQALSLALALGGILAAVLIALRYPLLNLMGITISGEEATGYATDFLIIRALAAPAVFSISASTGILRGYLDTKTPIFVLLVANVVNFLLDVVLIVMLGMGPMGAALATTTAEWISALMFLFVLAGKLPSADGELGKKEEDTIVVTPSLAIPPWEEVKPLVVASSSVFLRTTILQLFLSCSAAFAARGTDMDGGAASSIAAHQIAIQLWMLCSYTSDALAAASQGLVADALGRENQAAVKDVSKTVLVYSVGLGSILAAFLWIGFSTGFLLNLFTSQETTQADLLDIAALLIFSQPLNSIVFAADGILQGASEFPYQAKSMALSAFVAGSFFWILVSLNLTDQLFDVWAALICLQLMRGLASAYKIVDHDGPIHLLEGKTQDT